MAKRQNMPLVGRDKINRYNRQLILSLFKGGKRLARRDIVALTGMRQGTMQVHVEALLKEGILVERGTGRSKAGRRPRMLEINPTRYMIIGGYFRPDGIRLTLSDLLGRVVAEQVELPTVPDDRNHLLLALGRGLIKVIENRCRREDILGVALGVPGLVDPRDQVLTDAHFGSWWRGLRLGRYVQNQFGCRSWIDNDVRLATLAEARFGVCQDERDFLYVKIDHDIELGVMQNGLVYQGADRAAGRLGHACMDPSGLLCSCGNRGCLNTVASDTALVDTYRKLVHAAAKQVSVEDIVMQARSGDTAGVYALQQSARWLGLALSNLVNVMNPEKIVLAGQSSLAGELMLMTISQVISERTTPPARNVRIEWSQLADQAIPLGAIAVAIDDFYSLPVLETPMDLITTDD